MNINRTNEDKLELFADILEPAAAILTDETWALEWQAGNRASAIRAAVKNHKAEIVEILARIDGEDPEHYEIDGMRLFLRLYGMFNRPDLEGVEGLFTSRDQSAAAASSGPVTENTGEDGK